VPTYLQDKPVLIAEYKESSSRLTAKHVVEEAMTDALVRKCNSCKKPFLKEGGCNKMTCQCGNVQCFLCSKNVADYSHFGDAIGQCQMYGDMKEYLEKQVFAAQETTVKQILQSRRDLKDDDIRVDKAPNARPLIVENNAQGHFRNPVNTHPWGVPGVAPLFPYFPPPPAPPNVLPPTQQQRYPIIAPPTVNQWQPAIPAKPPIGVPEGYRGQYLYHNHVPAFQNVSKQTPRREYASGSTQTDFQAASLRKNQPPQGRRDGFF
jgi:TRIAD3 protein (E3 ubiquitin-protein ligase RNF216)